MGKITFERELKSLLNRYNKENESNTPDYILVEYLIGCLSIYNITLKRRDNWFGIDVWEKNRIKNQENFN